MHFGHVYVFDPFFNWVVCFSLFSCMSYVYILEINPSLVTSFAIIFSHSVGCLFILALVSLAVQKHVCLISSHFFIFVFISVALVRGKH